MEEWWSMASEENTHIKPVSRTNVTNTSHVCLARRLPPLNSNNECFLIFWIQNVFVSLLSERVFVSFGSKKFSYLWHHWHTNPKSNIVSKSNAPTIIRRRPPPPPASSLVQPPSPLAPSPADTTSHSFLSSCIAEMKLAHSLATSDLTRLGLATGARIVPN